MADPISEPVLFFAAVDVARPMDAKFLAELRDYTGIFAGYVLAGVVPGIFAIGNVFGKGRRCFRSCAATALRVPDLLEAARMVLRGQECPRHTINLST